MATGFDKHQPITQTALADLLKRDRQATGRALSEVRPSNGSKPVKFPLYEAIQAVLAAEQSKLDALQERARKDKELADKYELENAQTRGDLVSPVELDESIGNFIASLKGHLRRDRKIKKPLKEHIMGLVRECLEQEAKE